MQITQISEFTLVAETETTIHPLPSHGIEAVRTNHTQRKTGYLAFLEVENACEKETIAKTLEGVADPLLPSVRLYDKGLVIFGMDSTDRRKDAFDALCETAKSFCKSPQPRFYSGEQFLDLDAGAFAKNVKATIGFSVAPSIIKGYEHRRGLTPLRGPTAVPRAKLIAMEDIAKQKARLIVLNLRAKLLGFSVHASIGNKVHYGWWYIVVGDEPYHRGIYAICKSLDEADAFIRQKESAQKKGGLKTTGLPTALMKGCPGLEFAPRRACP